MFGRSFAMRVGVQHRVTQPNGLSGARCRNAECALLGQKQPLLCWRKRYLATFGIYTRSSNLPEAYIRDIAQGAAIQAWLGPPAGCQHAAVTPKLIPLVCHSCHLV